MPNGFGEVRGEVRAGSKYRWEELKKRYGDKYPNAQFWSWLKRTYPAGFPTDTLAWQDRTAPRIEKAISANIRNWYTYYRDYGVAQQQAQTTNWGDYYEQQYLSALRAQLEAKIVTGETTREEVKAGIQEVYRIIEERGLCKALPGYKELIVNTGIEREWKRTLNLYGQTVTAGNYDATFFNSQYYDTSTGEKYPLNVQEYIETITGQQIREAELRRETPWEAYKATEAQDLTKLVQEGKYPPRIKKKSDEAYYDLMTQYACIVSTSLFL